MTALKINELRQAHPQELREKIKQLKAQLFQFRLAAKQAKPEKPHIFKALRHDIARILTVLKEKSQS